MCPACPCCGYSTKAIVKNEIREITKSWMHRLTDVAPESRLRDLSIMTSHDCGTYSISENKVGSSVSRTQAIDVYQQLNLGIRQIDFRYGPNSNKMMDLSIRHGPHSGADYFREIIKVKHWLEDNPFEFLIIDAQCEKKINDEQRNYLSQFLIDKFGKYLITKEDVDTWFRVEEVTLSDLKKNHPKRVLLLVDSMISETDKDGSLEQKGLLDRSNYLVSKWHNTGNVKKLFEKIAEDVSQMNKNEGRFINLQLILTPKLHPTAVANYCVCADRFRIDQKQYLLFKNRLVQSFIREQAGIGVNFVMMDFVNYDPNIPNFLIGLNFPFKLNIHDFYFLVGKKNFNVTHQARELITSGNSLWLVSIAKDLGLKFSKAELHIIYEYEEEQIVHKKLLVTKEDQFLLNCITHLDITLDVPDSNHPLIEELLKRESSMFKLEKSIKSISSRNQTTSKEHLYIDTEEPLRNTFPKHNEMSPTRIAMKSEDPSESVKNSEL